MMVNVLRVISLTQTLLLGGDWNHGICHEIWMGSHSRNTWECHVIPTDELTHQPMIFRGTLW